MSGGAVNNLGAASSSAPTTTHHMDERTFNDYHFSCFVAMETAITIVPRFSLPRVECLGGVCGPFEPNYPVEVPLWLALHLRQTDTCTVTPPAYLRIPFLRTTLEREQASDSSFEALPFYFFEVAKRLCESGGGGGGGGSSSASPGAHRGGGGGGGHAADDIPHVAEVVRLVQEIKSVRQRKLKQSMGVFEPEGSAMFIPGIRLTHIICNELHFLRTSFAVVLQQACGMEARRARPTAHLTGSSGASALPRMPHVSVARTPARLSTVTTTSSVGFDASTAIEAAPSAGATSATQTGISAGGSPSQALEADGALSTQAESVAPLAQPPAKKRRTLRQT